VQETPEAVSPVRVIMPPGQDLLARTGVVIGLIFYVAGTISFAGIVVAYFSLKMYEYSDDTRIAFIVLFSSLFCMIQGLIFILITRGGELRRSQMEFMLSQIGILKAQGSVPRPTGPTDG
jgi:hypothetical protein